MNGIEFGVRKITECLNTKKFMEIYYSVTFHEMENLE